MECLVTVYVDNKQVHLHRGRSSHEETPYAGRRAAAQVDAQQPEIEHLSICLLGPPCAASEHQLRLSSCSHLRQRMQISNTSNVSLLRYLIALACSDVRALNHILVERDVTGGNDLLACLSRAARLLHTPAARPLRMIVIDSIAHIFRQARAQTSRHAGCRSA